VSEATFSLCDGEEAVAAGAAGVPGAASGGRPFVTGFDLTSSTFAGAGLRVAFGFLTGFGGGGSVEPATFEAGFVVVWTRR
jgi:hypothetical protein